jgi:hypothetical protein
MAAYLGVQNCPPALTTTFASQVLLSPVLLFSRMTVYFRVSSDQVAEITVVLNMEHSRSL